MNKELKQLLGLQDIDRVIDRLNGELEKLPRLIEEKRALIKQNQASLEEQKGRLTGFQLKKKEKEVELAASEERIRKHEGELNSIKSNEAYKALLSEIDNVRRHRGEIEDEILGLMEEADHAFLELKGLESESKAAQQNLEADIRAIEEQEKKVRQSLEAETKKRADFIPAIKQDLLSSYDFIRNKKKGVAIVYIEGESCSGCDTILTPNMVNQARKGKELVRCDSCSRILISRDMVAAPEPTAPVPEGQ